MTTQPVEQKLPAASDFLKLLASTTFVIGGVLVMLVLSGMTGVTGITVSGISEMLSRAVHSEKPVVKPEPKPHKVTIHPGSVRINRSEVRSQGLALVKSGAVTTTTGVNCDPLLDIKSGRMFPQTIVYLETLANAGFNVRVSCMKTGHSINVRNTDRTSLHTVWQGFDIDRINGQPICNKIVGANENRKCVAPSRQTLKLAAWFFSQPNNKLPFEVGGPFNPGNRSSSIDRSSEQGGPFFTNGGHQDHFHFGFKPADSKYPDSWWVGR